MFAAKFMMAAILAVGVPAQAEAAAPALAPALAPAPIKANADFEQ